MAFNNQGLNTLNYVAAAYVAGISDEEHHGRAALVSAIPATEVAGAGAIIKKDGVVDFSSINTGYTGTSAPSRAFEPTTPTDVELGIGENRDHIDMPWRLLVQTVASMSGGRVNAHVLNYADDLAGRVGLLKLAKLHRQQRRVNTALAAADSGALGTAIDNGADAVAVLDAAFSASRGDTLILREDGLKAFLRNASVRAAMAVSNASKSVSRPAFEAWLNDTFGWYAPWAGGTGGIRVEVDSLRVKTNDTGDYVMGNYFAVLRTLNSSGERPSRYNPATLTGRVKLPYGMVQAYLRPGETLESAPQNGTLLAAVSAHQRPQVGVLNYSLGYRAARDDDTASYRHYLDDGQGVTTIDSARLYVKSGVVT